MSGVAQADAAGLGTIEIRAMKKAGFSGEFSAAFTAASAIIGPIIPPSVIMVIFAVLAGVSVADLFLAGCFMETTAILIISVPALYPLITMLGIDPVQFVVMLVFNLLIGTVTPPFGVILFIIVDIAKIRLSALLWQIAPFYVPLFAVLALITFVPQVTLWLPGLVSTLFSGGNWWIWA